LGLFQIGRGSAAFNPLGGARPLAASDGVSLARFLEVGRLSAAKISHNSDFLMKS
jgi:hypothetical protein